MTRTIIAITEGLCVAGAILLAVLWVRNPNGNFEPPLALCTALLVPLEFVRRYLRSRRLRVFVSVGATYTQAQEHFVSTFESLLAENDCERLVVGRDNPPARQPVLEVRDLMKRADAVIVIAFTRYLVRKATEKPDADDSKQIRKIEDERYPTVWNQIEAAIAFGLNRPLLVIMEEGLKSEAMLKDRLEFRAIVLPLDSARLKTDDFKTRFASFTKLARRRSWFRL